MPFCGRNLQLGCTVRLHPVVIANPTPAPVSGPASPPTQSSGAPSSTTVAEALGSAAPSGLPAGVKLGRDDDRHRLPGLRPEYYQYSGGRSAVSVGLPCRGAMRGLDLYKASFIDAAGALRTQDGHPSRRSRVLLDVRDRARSTRGPAGASANSGRRDRSLAWNRA